MRLNTKRWALCVMLGLTTVWLSGCMTQNACYDGKHPVACTTGSDSIQDKMMYTPASIHHAWINRHLSGHQTIVSAHDIYWIGTPGHWNTPLSTPVGSGAALLGPTGE